MMAKKKKAAVNWLNPETTAENEVLPGYLEWAWTARGVSLAQNVVFLMQLTYFCTDMLGMSAKVVGALLLASKIFDGITDIIVGFIIDRTNTKIGKARPYELFILLVWGFTILLFSAPNLSQTGLCIFVFILYTLINSVCATFLNGGDAVYLARSVRSEKNRVSVTAFNGGIVMICSIVISIVMPQLIAGIGSTRPGWSTMSLMLGVPLGLIGILRFIFVKEVANTSNEAEASVGKAEPISLKKALSCIFKNKYVWILAGMTFVVQLMTNVGSSVSTYYFKYIIGDISLASVISLCGLVTPIVMLVFPVFSRKFGTVSLIKGGAVIGVVGYVLRTLGGTNMVTLTVGSLLGSIAVLPVSMMISIYLIDCMDYGEWKTGTRVEGFIGSVNSFMSKLGSGIASALVGLIMGISGYDGTLVAQSAGANSAIVALFNYLPLVLTIVLLVLAVMYKLDKEMPEIKASLAARKSNNS